MDKDELIKDIDELWNHFFQVRATYPYARPNHVGKTFIESAPYYRLKGLHLRVEFGQPLTMDDIERLRELGYWINQSVIIRLYALLEYHGVVSDTIRIDTTLDGHEEIDILRRLRKYFAHTGRYNETDKDQKRLFDRVVAHFNLIGHDKDRFPISIDTVVQVIFEKAKIYVGQIHASR
jgi:hypothetical protein